MKKMKVLAALTAAMCCMSTAFTPIMTTFAETENRDKVYDTSLILPEDTINVDKALRSLLWNSETNTRRINAYTALKQDKRTIEVHSTDPAVIEVVKAFVKDNALNEALIEYVLDEEEEQLTGDGAIPSELILPEETIFIDEVLRSLLWNSETNTRRINAYTALKQDKRTIEVHSTDPAVIEVVKAFVKDNALNEALIEYVLDEEEQLTDGDEINGDANCNGTVDMADAVLIMQSLSNPSKYGLNGTDENSITARGRKKADIAGNNDGVTNADALAIQKKLLKLE